MERIEIERSSSKKYLLKRDDKTKLVIISRDNVARVEAMIAENSRYNRDDENSSKTCFQTLLNELNNSDTPCFNSVEKAMIAVNKENSTRLSKNEIKELALRICELSSASIMKYLKNPQNSSELNNEKNEKYYLVKYLSEKTKGHGKRKGRRNYSFATKFCHYACMNFFEGTKDADNFPIIDDVIKSIFPKYAKESCPEFERINFDDYDSFVRSIDLVLKSHKNCISRNGFDHLMWYANK